ncbi:tumor necrosis factor alpha-induced protein 2 isoform X2 [Cololabis saira]|nr:tumor necrosis factor alpha-induced protein 2 isoform X2 [Cololabis saira]
MRIRSDSEHVRENLFASQSRSSPAGKWFRGKLPRFWGNQNPGAAVPGPPADGQPAVDAGPSAATCTFEQLLQDKRFFEASRQLIDRENQLLGDTTEQDKLKDCAEELSQLRADHDALEKMVVQSVQQSLSLVADEVMDEAAASALAAALASAVKAVYEEEVQDQRWKRRKSRSPSNWKKLHDATLRSLVESRLDSPVTRLAGEGEQSSLQLDVQAMGRQLREDLLLVVTALKGCYPPEADICHFYATLYHQAFSTRLRKMADFVLDEKDCTFVLRWVNDYYPGILKMSELTGEIGVAELGKLLPEDTLKSLEEQYLEKQKSDLWTYIHRVLEEEERKWADGEEPKRDDGCYVSPLAFDVIQLISGMVTAATAVTGSQDKAQVLTCKLPDFLSSWFKHFQENVMKQNGSNNRAHVKANLGCVEQFRDVLQRKSHFFQEDVQKSCLCILTEMKQAVHSYLLSPVHKTLRPQYLKVGTKDWLKKDLFDNLLSKIEKEAVELQGSSLPCHQELMGQFHREVTEEYVRKLLRGELKLKSREQQQAAYTAVADNAEGLHRLFRKMGSKEEWLKEILTMMAEVLKLQDLPAIQMQIVSLGSAYPDFSEKHVSALLKLKTNVSKADRRTVKETLSDTRRESNAGAAAPPFFSKIEVK